MTRSTTGLSSTVGSSAGLAGAPLAPWPWPSLLGHGKSHRTHDADSKRLPWEREMSEDGCKCMWECPIGPHATSWSTSPFVMASDLSQQHSHTHSQASLVDVHVEDLEKLD